MGEFKGTKGSTEVVEHSWSESSVIINGVTVCSLSIYNEATEETQDQLEDIMSANAELIRDAFNVRHQINCDLPELLQQRNEMLGMLQKIYNIENEAFGLKSFNVEDLKRKIGRVIKEATEL